MIYEKQYLQQTESLIYFYRTKNNPAIKDYILTCHNYINELRQTEIIELIDQIEYDMLFNQVLELVDETFRPNAFNSIITGENLRLLDDEFMIYLLEVKKQLKKPLKWKQLIELNFRFEISKMAYRIETKFCGDFTRHAIKNITLSELWNLGKK